MIEPVYLHPYFLFHRTSSLQHIRAASREKVTQTSNHLSSALIPLLGINH